MSIDTTPRTERVNKFEFMAQCRRAIIAAGWPTGWRLLYQTAAEMCWATDAGWVLPYERGFSQRALSREAGMSAGSGTKMWRELFQADWLTITPHGPKLTPERGRARSPERASALPRARKRAPQSAPSALPRARERAPQSAQVGFDPICISDSQINTSDTIIRCDGDDGFAREVEEVAAIVAKVRGIDHATIHERAATIIATTRKCLDVRQSPMLTSIEFAEFLLWSVQGVGLKNPAGRFTRLATQVPDATMIGQWRRKTAISHAPKPAAMIEAKPREVSREQEIAELERQLARPDLTARGRKMLEVQLAEARGDA